MTAHDTPPGERGDRLEEAAFTLRSELFTEGWGISTDDRQLWTEYSPPGQFEREAGTKLHVTSSVRCAAEVLTACAPILRQHHVGFKHASNLRVLAHLSTGEGGRSQVGKFLTVYPRDETSAMVIAEELDRATMEHYGPRIPNEKLFRDGSLVSSRFGSFGSHWVQLPSGRIVPAVVTADGLDIDDRSANNEPRKSTRSRIVGQKYVRLNTMFESPKGRTCLGVIDNASGGDFVVIKEAFGHTMEEVDGRSATTRLSNEAACLRALGPARIAPTLIDYWDDPDTSFLIYQPIQGPTLGAIIGSLAAQGLRPPPHLLHEWMTSLCQTVAALHRCGYVSCDIKPANIVMTNDGFKLIDLELAGPQTCKPTGSMGTPGYCSPEQADTRAGRSVLDDVYGIGATLLSAATSSDASNWVNAEAVAQLEYARAPYNPIIAVAARCLRQDPNDRFQSVDGIVEAVEHQPPVPPTPPAGFSPLTLAIEIADRIVAEATPVDERRLYWTSDHHTLNRQPSRDLYAGSSGIALLLCALAGATGNDEYLKTATRCGTWLWETEPIVPRREAMPGLYFGEAGPALLYLMLHCATKDALWLDRCNEMATRLDTISVRSPDLMTGLAGVGLFHLMRWHIDRCDSTLDAADRCARVLLARREPDRLIWRMPEDFDLLSRQEYLGFAHGSAGIGYFLAEHALASGHEASRAMSHQLADWIIELAHPALGDGSGVYWTATETSERSSGTNWCHGAPGMARFLMKAHATTNDPSHLESAMRAARMTAAGGSWIGTSQCHGLAGNIEVLIDAALQTNQPSFLEQARLLTENLVSYRMDGGWPSDERSKRCPDLMIGEAGIAAAFLRMAKPISGHIISCEAIGKASSHHR